jgi:hypothetical protein
VKGFNKKPDISGLGRHANYNAKRYILPSVSESYYRTQQISKKPSAIMRIPQDKKICRRIMSQIEIKKKKNARVNQKAYIPFT